MPPGANANGKTRVAVLFSGGLDCTVLARLCHEVLPPDQGIDLLNVAFENPRVVAQLQKENGNLPDFYEACPDRVTGRRSFAELQRSCPGRAFQFMAVSIFTHLLTDQC
jgi:asparagine synthetase B (glutamine-hydrolysing)